MRHFPWKESGWAIGIVFVLLGLYVLAYWMLAKPAVLDLEPPGGGHFRFPDIEAAADPPPPPPPGSPESKRREAFRSVAKAIGGAGEDGPPDRRFRVKPQYGFGGDSARMLFTPVHELDVKLRYDLWHVNLKWMP